MTDTVSQESVESRLRALPGVDTLLNHAAINTLLAEFPRAELVRCIRDALERRRAAIRAGEQSTLDIPVLALEIRERLYARGRPALRRVINATGIVLHTGLGRAPLAEAAVEAIAEVAAGYSNLEYDLERGERGDRHAHVRDLLRELTGAEDALVVNNNAAATYLVLQSLAAGKGVVVSRGQLVEIGGSYRMPEIMAAAGCRMVEVGATNRTHLDDYVRAIDEQTSVLLHVHTSNYRIEGFATSPSVAELRRLDSERDGGLHVIDDLGSGLLIRPDVQAREDSLARRLAEWDEPSVPQSVADGADLTLFSGDKLLGGPQAGVIVGRSRLIERLRANPLMRTFRPDKMTLAGLEATLRLYRDPEALAAKLPVYQMLLTEQTLLEATANTLAEQIRAHAPSYEAQCAKDNSFAGGGSLPTIPFPTWVVAVRHPRIPATELTRLMRSRDLPIVARIRDEHVRFDCRSLRGDDAEQILTALADAEREIDGR